HGCRWLLLFGSSGLGGVSELHRQLWSAALRKLKCCQNTTVSKRHVCVRVCACACQRVREKENKTVSCTRYLCTYFLIDLCGLGMSCAFNEWQILPPSFSAYSC